MKKHHYLLILAWAIAAIVPSVTYAESGSSDDSSSDDSKQTLIRERLRIKTDDGEYREDIRNKLLNGRIATSTRIEMRTLASTTRGERVEIRTERREEADDVRKEMRERMKSASSSDDRREIHKEMRKDVFEIRKQSLIRQLNVSLNNLKQIRQRISSRIDKAVASGRNMTEAQRLLVIADAKIAAAEMAINSIVAFDSSTQLASLTDTASSTTATSTTATSTVNLTKPREMGDKAIKAVKDAHKALVDVVRAIAHAMGIDKIATTTPPTATTTDSTATTTDSTATTTSSTTPNI